MIKIMKILKIIAAYVVRTQIVFELRINPFDYGWRWKPYYSFYEYNPKYKPGCYTINFRFLFFGMILFIDNGIRFNDFGEPVPS